MNPISQAFSTVNASLESKEQDQGTKRTNPINQLIEKMSETTKGINLPKSIGDLLNPNKLSSLLPSFKGEDKESGVQLETNKINLNRANPMLSEMQTQGIRFEKFCEQLIIQTPEGTPAESANYIVKEIMRKINGGFDGL